MVFGRIEDCSMNTSEKPIWKADVHTHTTVSDGLLTRKQMAARAKAAGLHLFSFTDHDRISRLEDVADEFKESFVPGGEISSAQGHVNVLVPQGVTIKGIARMRRLRYTVEEIHDLGGKAVIPHLGSGIPLMSAYEEAVDDIYQRGGKVDGIETGTYPTYQHAERAKRLAEKYAIAQLGVSDDHFGNIGREYITIFERKTDSAKDDFFEALESGTTQAQKSDEEKYTISMAVMLKQMARGFFFDADEKLKKENMITLAKSWYSILKD